VYECGLISGLALVERREPQVIGHDGGALLMPSSSRSLIGPPTGEIGFAGTHCESVFVPGPLRAAVGRPRLGRTATARIRSAEMTPHSAHYRSFVGSVRANSGVETGSPQ
jgi:hypothetical protein